MLAAAVLGGAVVGDVVDDGAVVGATVVGAAVVGDVVAGVAGVGASVEADVEDSLLDEHAATLSTTAAIEMIRRGERMRPQYDRAVTER